MNLTNGRLLSRTFPSSAVVGWFRRSHTCQGGRGVAARRCVKSSAVPRGETDKLGRCQIKSFVARCASSTANVATSEEASKEPSSIQAMPSMTGAEIRERFLSFFEEKGHTRLPSASLVPEDPTVLLTIAGMLQFKPIFMGLAPPQHRRVTTTQKCVRTNDVENVGVTARHHTFFEMLGNFSFGDYFKTEAIQWAWDLSTKVYKLPGDRIFVSVFETDDEAFEIWRDVVGVPSERILRMGEEENFWASGATGPCGPCSELYYDFHPERGLQNVDLNDDSRFIEFYNLVFMEMNRDPKGSLTPLKSKNIDTGMGLERMAQILQGTPNNYETDLMISLLDNAAALAGIPYNEATASQKRDLKVIGDHTRAITYLISDGVLPSNVGRGYVVRRLVRRTIMKGRLLGIKNLFTATLAKVAMEMSDGCDPAVRRNGERICSVLLQEESLFTKTLASGQKKLEEMLKKYAPSNNNNNGKKKAVMSGEDAFTLFDTYGFPLEITQEIVEGEGMTVDIDGFSEQMKLQKQRSKDAREDVDMTAGADVTSLVEAGGSTEFVGYHTLTESGNVVAIFVDGKQVKSAEDGANVEVVLDKSPFYAESGGQIGDKGVLMSNNSASVRIQDCQKVGGGELNLHKGKIEGGQLSVGDVVVASVDSTLRRRTRCNHTATHLLQAALKTVLGEETSQQGSLVSSDRLRFDFNLGRAMTQEETEQVENLVNSWVQQGQDLTTKSMPIGEAKEAGAIAMFGEKYGDVVRVVDVPGVSLELCGGTHVANTAEIGGFKVLSEMGIQSGVRRIEAVAGPGVMEYLSSVDKVVRSLRSGLKLEAEKIPGRVEAMQQELVASKKEIEGLKGELAVAKAQALVGKAITLEGGTKILVTQLEGVEGKALQEAAQNLQESLGDPAAVVLGCGGAGKVGLAVAFSPGIIASGLKAGQFVGGIAKMCGGGGGGRPNLAQAGGKLPEKLPEALQAAEEQLKEGLKE
ncbi:hypothetical protein BSKO_09437 [Bryopsis sp. KO-2023]|nr:hypothetical protein BSKO_09437 [Bryopsis sp. KO-2023]